MRCLPIYLSIKIRIIDKRTIYLGKKRMASVFLREDDIIFWQLPIYIELWIIPCDGTLALRMVKIVAFILENHFIAQHAETMCKPSRDKKLILFLTGEFHGYPFTKGR